MDQQKFESEVMQNLAAEAPLSSADNSFDDAPNIESYEEDAIEDAAIEETDMFEEGGEESRHNEDAFADGFEEDLGKNYAEEDITAWQALEDAMADALTAEDSDAFLRTILGGIGRVSGLTQQAATAASQTAQRAAGRVAEDVGRVSVAAGRIAEQARTVPDPLTLVWRRLRQHLGRGSQEDDAFEDLANTFAEGDMDEALPVLAGMAARTVIRPILRRIAGKHDRPLRRQLIRSTMQAAQTLMRRQGPQALRAFPQIAQSMGRTAERQRLRPAALPEAISRTVTQVAARPDFVHRLTRHVSPQAGVCPMCQQVTAGRRPHRVVVQGPVEIAIIPR